MPHLLHYVSKLRGRIYIGKDKGVFFSQGGNGWVEDCQIWGNPNFNVQVHGSGSHAVVKDCECANACAFSMSP